MTWPFSQGEFGQVELKENRLRRTSETNKKETIHVDSSLNANVNMHRFLRLRVSIEVNLSNLKVPPKPHYQYRHHRSEGIVRLDQMLDFPKYRVQITSWLSFKPTCSGSDQQQYNTAFSSMWPFGTRTRPQFSSHVHSGDADIGPTQTKQ